MNYPPLNALRLKWGLLDLSPLLVADENRPSYPSCSKSFVSSGQVQHQLSFILDVDSGIPIPVDNESAIAIRKSVRRGVRQHLHDHSAEHVLDEGNHLSILMSCLPCSSNLYRKNVVNIPHPLSATLLPKRKAFDIPFISRSSMTTQSYLFTNFLDS